MSDKPGISILDDLPTTEQMNQPLASSQLWVISYSDFMTILMIFFLMLFAHRVWEKKVSWEADRVSRVRAAQEAQRGMVQRLSRMAAIDVSAERINIHLPEALLYGAGQVELSANAEQLLAELAPELATFSGDIIVEGHTDDIAPGPKSRYPSNWDLSVARSFGVIRYLSEHGVSPTKMSARGYGPYRPRAANDNPIGRAENRRIEIVLINPKKR